MSDEFLKQQANAIIERINALNSFPNEGIFGQDNVIIGVVPAGNPVQSSKMKIRPNYEGYSNRKKDHVELVLSPVGSQIRQRKDQLNQF